jgi:hypothetical protein
MMIFGNWLPAASYPGLKKLDWEIGRECAKWQKRDKETKEGSKIIGRSFIGCIFGLISLFIANIFSLSHPLVALVGCLGSFYLPVQMFKWWVKIWMICFGMLKLIGCGFKCIVVILVCLVLFSVLEGYLLKKNSNNCRMLVKRTCVK